MEEYLEQILAYLPMKFVDKEANDFIKYLSEAYLENILNKKYQFSFKAFHMLYMTFIYKISWFISINNDAQQIFDYSYLTKGESDAIRVLLKKKAFHKNAIQKCQNLVNVRNHCSHASGKIEYDDKGISYFIDEEIKSIILLQHKIEPEMKKFLEQFLEKNWQKTFITGDFNNLFNENYFSLKDLETISKIDLELLKLNSDSEKIIKEKILYLLLILDIQNKIITEENLFLSKLALFMSSLPKKIKIISDEKEKEIYTSSIIDEFLIPIISKLSDDDRIQAEKILKIN
jgi:hypothetical protein